MVCTISSSKHIHKYKNRSPIVGVQRFKQGMPYQELDYVVTPIARQAECEERTHAMKKTAPDICMMVVRDSIQLP